jgi:hypothetical protein
MDDARFDDLARALTAPSRRSFLSGATALALLLGWPTSSETLAKKRKKRKKRKKHRKPGGTDCQAGTRSCGDKCLTAEQCCDNADCDPRQTCNAANACVGCERQCGGAECGDDGCGGSCGACEAGERCQDGQCICVPDCAGTACGPDGCGSQCARCGTGDVSQENACVCGTPGGLGPGEICTSAAQCCPYSGEEICSKGSGFCATFFPACRSGFGGTCSGNCDCLGNLECRGGSCRCPGDRDYLGNGLCCGEGLTRCGGICCHGPDDCLCFPGFDCRCKTLPG